MAIEHFLLSPLALTTALNLAVAATLASLAGIIAVRCWQTRSVPLRYSILLASLTLVLLTPAPVMIAQRFDIGLIRIAALRSPAKHSAPRDAYSNAVLRFPATVDGLSTSNQPYRRDSIPAGAATEIADAAEQQATANGSSRAARRTRQTADLAGNVWQVAASLLVAGWALGAVVAFVRLLRGWRLMARLRRSLVACHDGRALRFSASAAQAVGLRRGPPIFESPLAPAPLSLGLLCPAVVQPAGLVDQLDDAQLQAVLLHEMAHIAHRDLWIGLLQRLAAVAYWWNPLLHHINHQLSELREQRCDNYVVGQQGSGRRLAQVLVGLAERAAYRWPSALAVGLLESDLNGLEGRIKRLVSRSQAAETRLHPAVATLVAALGLVVGCLLVGANILAGGEPDDSTPANQTVKVDNQAALVQALAQAKPGVRILIAPGTYRGGLTLDNLQGSKEQPIIIAAADPRQPPVIEGGNSGLHLTDPAYLELRDLLITGSRINGLNIDDGGSYDTPAHHVVLRRITVRDVGSNGNQDGIKLSGLDDFRVAGCTVERWGKSGSAIDLVGCHRGEITGSTFLEGGLTSANAVQMKGGSRDIAVRRCRFEDAGGRAINIGGSTGRAYFRPRPQGYEAKDIVVEDCTFIGSMAPLAFVGVDGATVRHNTIYLPTRWVLRILQENQDPEFVACGNGRFTDNIIAFRSDELTSAVNIGPRTEPKSFVFAGNFWYCIDRPEKSRRSISLPTAEKNGVYEIDPMFIDPDRGNLKLQEKSPVRNAGPRSKRVDSTEEKLPGASR